VHAPPGDQAVKPGDQGGDAQAPPGDQGGDAQAPPGDQRRDAHAPPAERCVVRAPARWDLAIARLAAAQHGVVTRSQLAGLGLGRGAIAHRVARGRLHRVHRGVYLVGHPVLAPLAAEVAAVLACGPGAVLSHRSAAGLWGLLASTGPVVDVTVPGRNPGPRSGVLVHRVARLDRGDVTRRRGIAVTAPARTLLDLAELLPSRALERALEEAEIQGLARPRDVLALLERSPGRRGAALLRTLLRDGAERAVTRSEAEDRLLALLRAAGLSPTAVNVRVASHEVDAVWHPERLVVEVDGYAYHASRAAFERDRRRDADLQAAGYRVIRVTWRQLAEEPHALVARLAQALARGPT
jgi:very-short-patch-repair endonuclease